MTEPVFYTATTLVETPRGDRWQGVTYTPGGRETRVRQYANERGERLPRKAIVVYRSRLHRHANLAYEAARSRTVHWNLFHDESEWARTDVARRLHGRYRCPFQ